MNNEIKEILEYFEINVENNSIYMLKLDTNEAKVLLDYITNLQEYYNDNVNKYEELIVKYSNLQEENERLLVDNKTLKRWYQLCKSRKDKAIEYIKENCIDDEFYINLSNKEKHIIEVLNILKGGDDNE